MRRRPEYKTISSAQARRWIRETARLSVDVFRQDSLDRELIWQQDEATSVLGTGKDSLSIQSHRGCLYFDRHSWDISSVMIEGVPDIRLGIRTSADWFQIEDPLAA